LEAVMFPAVGWYGSLPEVAGKVASA